MPEERTYTPENPKYGVEVTLTGTDSNAFALVGTVVRELKPFLYDEMGMTREEVKAELDAFRKEAYSGDYEHLLYTCMCWVDTT